MVFSNKLVKEEEIIKFWFCGFDALITGCLSGHILTLIFWSIFGGRNSRIVIDIKKICVHHINGINIYPFELTVSFNNLSDKEKKLFLEKKI